MIAATPSANFPTRVGPIIQRIEKLNDAELGELSFVARKTFLDTHQGVDEEFMNAYVESSFHPTRLTSEIDEPKTAWFLTKDAEKIVGYLKITAGVNPEFESDTSYGYLERSYVLHSYHGRGLGLRLIQAGLDWAREQRLQRIWLRTWSKNQNAIAFFQKLGFQMTGDTYFKMQTQDGRKIENLNYVMELDLRS